MCLPPAQLPLLAVVLASGDGGSVRGELVVYGLRQLEDPAPFSDILHVCEDEEVRVV